MTAEKEALEAAARAGFDRFMDTLCRDDPDEPRPKWEDADAAARQFHIEDATAIVTAYLAAREALGWREMPRNPTPEMREAAGKSAMKINPAMKRGQWKAIALDSQSIYRAMWDVLALDAAQGGGADG